MSEVVNNISTLKSGGTSFGFMNGANWLNSQILAKILFNLRLSGFEILNDSILIFQTWPIYRLFTNIFYNPNFAEEDKL